jgi:HAD superfamily hydrolase (TIGR01509 family)
MLPSAVLFDMDGVLVRSEEVWFRVVEAAGLRFRGYAVTRDEFFPTFGQGTAADLRVFELRCTRAELDAFYVTEFARHLDAVWVNPEAAPLLTALRDRGVKLALVTNTVEPLASRVIDFAQLGALLPVRATADQVANGKPAPDLLLAACARLQVDPRDAWMVGDSAYDRGAAQAAGCRFIGLRLAGDLRLERLADFPLT